MKEIKLKLNTADGQTSFKTSKINGALNTVIVDAEESLLGFFNYSNYLSIIIESEQGYLILHRRDIKGLNHFIPRTRTTTPIEDMRDFPGYDKFILNEKLIITIIGPKNKDVDIILRVD